MHSANFRSAFGNADYKADLNDQKTIEDCRNADLDTFEIGGLLMKSQFSTTD